MDMKKYLFVFAGLLVVALVVVMILPQATAKTSGPTVTIYKSPTCGCCVSYSHYLESKGYNVETVTTDDMESIKQEYNIPRNMQSCHTMVIGDYFVEGHVPIEVVEKLMTEQPKLNGIALPDMPAGSPGMPGVKGEDWEIYSLVNGESSEFMRM